MANIVRDVATRTLLQAREIRGQSFVLERGRNEQLGDAYLQGFVEIGNDFLKREVRGFLTPECSRWAKTLREIMTTSDGDVQLELFDRYFQNSGVHVADTIVPGLAGPLARMNAKAWLNQPSLHDFGDGQGPVPAHRHSNLDGTVGGWVAETAHVEQTVYIAPNAKVYDHARVYGYARILDHAQVYENADVMHDAEISGNAQIYGNAQVRGHARVYEEGQVFGSAEVDIHARVYGRGKVHGSARVWGKAEVYGDSEVCDCAYVSSTVKVCGNAKIGDYEFFLQGEKDNKIETHNSKIQQDEVKQRKFPRIDSMDRGGTGQLHDFGDGKGPVAAHRHRNPDGSLGGWVADSATVAQTTYIEAGAQVYGNAQVLDYAQIRGSSRVYGNAQVYGNARVKDRAQIYGRARVYGNAMLSEFAQIFGHARVYGNAQVYGHAKAYEFGQIYAKAQVRDYAEVFQYGRAAGKAIIEDINKVCFTHQRFFTYPSLYGPGHHLPVQTQVDGSPYMMPGVPGGRF